MAAAAEVTYDVDNICHLLQRDGYVHLKNCVELKDIASAVRAINFEIGEGISKEDIGKMKINAISFGTNRLRQSKPITNLLYNTCAIRLAEELYGIDNIYLPEYYTQIALRFPQVCNRAELNKRVSNIVFHFLLCCT